MKGFIIYPTYKIIDRKAYACLYGRLENGESFLTINYARPYFYIKQSDLKDALNLGKFDHEATDFKDFAGNKVAKIILDIPSDVVNLRDSFHQNSIDTYEADIKFPYRFMIDNFLQSSLDIEGSFEPSDKIDRVYREPEIKPANYIPKLKVLSFDIETSLDGKHLYCIGLYSKDYSNVFVIGNKPLKNATLCKNEEDLLEKFKEEVQKLDPDVLTGWNMIDFDLKYLQDKFKKYNIDFNLGRDNSSSKIRIEKDFFRDSKAEIAGRQVLDGLHLLKASFIKVEDYKLNTVAYQVLGKRKLLQGDNRHEQIEEYFKKDRQKLVDYNLEDAKLVYEIIEKTGTLDLTIQRSLLTGMPLDRVNASIASLDSLYLKEARRRNLVCPTASFGDREKRIIGGYVMEGKPGIYDYIITLDFKSLYPSLMRTFNIDPASYITKKEPGCIIAPNGAMFRNDQGILPEIIREMYEHRLQAKRDKNDLATYAIKIHLNSMFGVLANPTCRFYNFEMANAITHFGQFLIKLTAKKIEEAGYEVIYSDTDSAFVNSKAKTYEEATAIGKKLQDYINSFYQNYIKTKYKRESHLDLQFDRCFIRFLMPKIRGSEAGAKKRYAGLYLKDGKEDILTVGIEAIRCFVPKENLVPTIDKIKKLNELNIDDKLFGMDLETKKIQIVSPKNFFEYDYNGKIVRIETEGGYNFKTTPQHNFFILIPSSKTSRYDRNFSRYKAGYTTIKSASELKKGDYLISLKKIPYINEQKIDDKKVYLASFFGYFLGEGRLYERYSKRGLHQRRIDFTFGENEKEIIEDCRFIFKKIFNKELLTYNGNSRKCLTLYADLNKELYAIIKDDLILNQANNNYRRTLALTHKVPEFILNGNKKIISSFLQAYFDAEGTVGRKLGVTTVSKELSQGVCYLLKKLGIQYNYSISKANLKYKRVHDAYRIEIGLNGYYPFLKDIGFKLRYKQQRLLKELKTRSLKRARYIRPITENLILRKIKRTIEENYIGKVYDVEIDSNNKNYFIDYILTHNSDWTDAAQKFQVELLNKIFHKEEITEYVAKFIKDLQAGKYDSQLVYRKSIRKELEKYVRITPPHVKAARQLDKLEGNLIEYYITEEGPEPIQKLKHKLDYDHYINKQIRPIADMVLTFFNKDFDDLLQGSKQTKLFEF